MSKYEGYTHMEPENTPLEKENHLPNHHFQVLINLRGCIIQETLPETNRKRSYSNLSIFRLPPLLVSGKVSEQDKITVG